MIFEANLHQGKERQTWEKVIISEGVEIVPAYTFYNWKRLKMLTLSHSVKRIDYRAFQACGKLADIYITRLDIQSLSEEPLHKATAPKANILAVSALRTFEPKLTPMMDSG